MKNLIITRRKFVAGVGAAALALPFAKARAASMPTEILQSSARGPGDSKKYCAYFCPKRGWSDKPFPPLENKRVRTA